MTPISLQPVFRVGSVDVLLMHQWREMHSTSMCSSPILLDVPVIFNICHKYCQFSSVTQSRPTLCNPMNHSTPGLPVHHHLPEFTQTHVHRGEGNGTPLQYSCLENPMDGGAWWAAVHGVTKSQIRLSHFTFTFSLSCIGKGNGNPLQCSCLENPRGRRAWWADVYGVTQSRTRLK